MIQHGLLNDPGAMNCFLNVILQSLWRLPRVRSRLISSSLPSCNAMTSSLQALFTAYTYSEDIALPPDSVRVTLERIATRGFKRGEMEDACEAFEVVLRAVHSQKEGEEKCDDRDTCVGHRCFAFEVVESTRCDACGATNGMDCISSEFAFRVYAQEVVDRAGGGGVLKAIRTIGTESRSAECPEGCSKSATCATERVALNAPEVMSLHVVWPAFDESDSSAAELVKLIKGFMAVLTKTVTFRLKDGFDTVSPEHGDAKYKLNGLVAYYGKHYLYFGACESNTFVLFDDETMKKIGTFDAVVDRCVRGKLQPVLIFYEKIESQNAAHDEESGDDHIATVIAKFIKERVRGHTLPLNKICFVQDATTKLALIEIDGNVLGLCVRAGTMPVVNSDAFETWTVAETAAETRVVELLIKTFEWEVKCPKCAVKQKFEDAHLNGNLQALCKKCKSVVRIQKPFT